jgi:hypothetical protein
MTGKMTAKIVAKAHYQLTSVRREYMLFASNEQGLRIVLNPETYKVITEEFWWEQRQRAAGVHQGYWVEEVRTPIDGKQEVDDRMLGIRVMTDPAVPEEEVEVRAILQRSWEPVL